MTDCVVGMVTCSSRAEARKVAKEILTRKLAACVNIVDGLESHYWWQGKLARAAECLLLIKTTRARSKAVAETVRSVHSYEVPEVIFQSIVTGDRKYLNWLRSSVAKVAAISLLALAPVMARADQVDDLIKQLGAAEEETRAEAADSLARIGGPRVERQFREMIASSNPERRQVAVVGLLQVSDDDADVERVRVCLKDPSSTVRWSAVLALGQSGRTEAIPWLAEIETTDQSEVVREGVTEALAKLRGSIDWRRSLREALNQARTLRKPVLAYFFVRGSEFCERFEQGVLADKPVVDAAQEFVCVRLNALTQNNEARKLDVRGAPTVLVLDDQGNEISRVAGLVDKSSFLSKLSETRRGKLTFREARRLALRNPADVQANWKVAETYLEEGREDQAEPHLRNVIASDEQNQYGYTDNAMFALGYALGKRGEHAQAAYGLEQLLARWPDFKDKDKALYCLGLSQLAIGQKQKGRASLEQLVREFPGSSTVQSARLALDKLNASEGK